MERTRPSWSQATGRRKPVVLSTGGPEATDDAAPLLKAEIIGRGEFGERRLRFVRSPDFYAVLDRLGHMPLPPYIHRDDALSRIASATRRFMHQQRGSVAAPTAGLHFTQEVLDAIRARGVEIAHVTLHVGTGNISAGARGARGRNSFFTRNGIHCRGDRRRHLIAHEKKTAVLSLVGTTTVRTLEHCALRGRQSICGRIPEKRNLYLAGISISPGAWTADKFSSAAVDSVDAGLRLRRPETVSSLQPRGPAGVSVLLLWRLYVPRLNFPLQIR